MPTEGRILIDLGLGTWDLRRLRRAEERRLRTSGTVYVGRSLSTCGLHPTHGGTQGLVVPRWRGTWAICEVSGLCRVCVSVARSAAQHCV